MTKHVKPKCETMDTFFSKQIPASAKRVQDDITTESPSICSTAVTISHEPFTPEDDSEVNASSSSLLKAAAASVNLPSYPDISRMDGSDIQNPDVKMKLLTCTLKDTHNFSFPVRYIH